MEVEEFCRIKHNVRDIMDKEIDNGLKIEAFEAVVQNAVYVGYKIVKEKPNSKVESFGKQITRMIKDCVFHLCKEGGLFGCYE